MRFVVSCEDNARGPSVILFRNTEKARRQHVRNCARMVIVMRPTGTYLRSAGDVLIVVALGLLNQSDQVPKQSTTTIGVGRKK